MRAVHELDRTSYVAGGIALPCPGGSPHDLRAAARTLDRAASRARTTTTVAGSLGRRLDAVWTGAAATAAKAQADELAHRSRRVVDALPTAAGTLRSYAAALDHAVGRIRALQRQWDALDADHALASLRVATAPDPAGTLGVLALQRADAQRAAGRARLSRSHAGVLDELRVTATRCAHVVAALTESTLPHSSPATAAAIRYAVTGGLSFADGLVSARESRTAALADASLVRGALAATGSDARAGPVRPVDDAAAAQVVHRVRERVADPVYAQTLLAELGTDGLYRLLMATGAASGSASGAHVDTVRDLLGTLGSLVVTATTHDVPSGTDPRTRKELASEAALLADDVVAGLARTHAGESGTGRASGAWLFGQLLSGARASGDDRMLPARLVRRAAAAAAAAEIAETRDADVELRHGTTLPVDAGTAFASWFDDPTRTGDALHVLLAEVGDDPTEQAALLTERLPESAGAGGPAPANARGDRLTLGEHLVRRWITFEASGIETHTDLRLATDGDLLRLLPSISTATSPGAAEARARVMLELSRTSSFAMSEASTTGIYTRATAPLEDLVVAWFSAMRTNVDRALASPLFGSVEGYAAETADGHQPLLHTEELTRVIAALTVETGTGLHSKDPGAAYDRLLDAEIARTRASVADGRDSTSDLARIGFLDQSASAALVAMARRQDELSRAALQGVADAKNVVREIRNGGPVGLASMVHTYATSGTSRTATDDLVIALVRSDVELAQTERDAARRAALLARIEAFTGPGDGGVRSSFAWGAGRAPAVPTAEALRAARAAEIRAAWDAFRDSATQRILEEPPLATRHAPDGVKIAEGRNGRISDLDRLPRGKSSTVKLVESEAELRRLFGDLTRGAIRLDEGSYPGERYLRSDGVEVRLRGGSTSGGATIDLKFIDGTKRKVHIR